jgi:DNA-binding XRE family transcriptional regulator
MRQMMTSKVKNRATVGKGNPELGSMMKKARRCVRPGGVGFSQTAMAKSLALDRATIGRWETGEKIPLPHHLVDYCNVLVRKGVSRGDAAKIFAYAYPGRTDFAGSDTELRSAHSKSLANAGQGEPPRPSHDAGDSSRARRARLTGKPPPGGSKKELHYDKEGRELVSVYVTLQAGHRLVERFTSASEE